MTFHVQNLRRVCTDTSQVVKGASDVLVASSLFFGCVLSRLRHTRLKQNVEAFCEGHHRDKAQQISYTMRFYFYQIL